MAAGEEADEQLLDDLLLPDDDAGHLLFDLIAGAAESGEPFEICIMVAIAAHGVLLNWRRGEAPMPP